MGAIDDLLSELREYSQEKNYFEQKIRFLTAKNEITCTNCIKCYECKGSNFPSCFTPTVNWIEKRIKK